MRWKKFPFIYCIRFFAIMALSDLMNGESKSDAEMDP